MGLLATRCWGSRGHRTDRARSPPVLGAAALGSLQPSPRRERQALL